MLLLLLELFRLYLLESPPFNPLICHNLKQFIDPVLIASAALGIPYMVRQSIVSVAAGARLQWKKKKKFFEINGLSFASKSWSYLAIATTYMATRFDSLEKVV